MNWRAPLRIPSSQRGDYGPHAGTQLLQQRFLVGVGGEEIKQRRFLGGDAAHHLGATGRKPECDGAAK